MNKLQIIASKITGYDPSVQESSQGIKDYEYFLQSTPLLKLTYIMHFSFKLGHRNALTIEEAKDVFWFIEDEYADLEEMYHRFTSLGYQEAKHDL